MIEIQRAFKCEEEWCTFFTKYNFSESELIDSINHIKKFGIESNFFGFIPPEEIEITEKDLREELKAKNLNSRQRAVLELLAKEEKIGKRGRAKIFAPEAITPLALELRGRFPFFIGSEYTTSKKDIERLYPIPIEDLQCLSFKSNIFDAVISCDVLEHIPNIKKSLIEMYRILKPGGVMISTHPFTWSATSLIKSILVKNKIIHLSSPEYHGNPIDPKGSLVFTIPGWDIINQCLQIGFTQAEEIIMASTKNGIFGNNPLFINILKAYK